VPRTFISKVGSFLNTNLPALLMPLDLTVRAYYYQRVFQGKANGQRVTIILGKIGNFMYLSYFGFKEHPLT